MTCGLLLVHSTATFNTSIPRKMTDSLPFAPPMHPIFQVIKVRKRFKYGAPVCIVKEGKTVEQTIICTNLFTKLCVMTSSLFSPLSNSKLHQRKHAKLNVQLCHMCDIKLYDWLIRTHLISTLSVADINSHTSWMFRFGTKGIQTVTAGRITNLRAHIRERKWVTYKYMDHSRKC